MKITSLIIVVLIGVTHCLGQTNHTIDIEGKYFKPKVAGIYSRESLFLNENKTFEYINKSEFIEFTVKGYWRIDEGYLLLNSTDSLRKDIEVKELFKKDIHNDKIKVRILYDDGTTPNCTVTINKGDETEKEYRTFGTIILPKKSVKSITVYTVIKHKTYLIKSCKANYFEIKVTSKRIMSNERWLLTGKGIIPIDFNGIYANYSLLKQ